MMRNDNCSQYCVKKEPRTKFSVLRRLEQIVMNAESVKQLLGSLNQNGFRLNCFRYHKVWRLRAFWYQVMIVHIIFKLLKKLKDLVTRLVGQTFTTKDSKQHCYLAHGSLARL